MAKLIVTITVKRSVKDILDEMALEHGYLHKTKPCPAKLLTALAYGHLELKKAPPNSPHKINP